MTFDNDNSISFCPYCGSKEIITESDYVKVEQIKNKRIENIAYNKNQNELDIEKQKLEYELKKKKIENQDQTKTFLIIEGSFIILIIIGIVLYKIFC